LNQFADCFELRLKEEEAAALREMQTNAAKEMSAAQGLFISISLFSAS